ncbi:MAG: 4Fe-4S binding protein [Oscillospiraceae bacterium]|nr:4Fe-4S binding protein [Oscillospiraceae bacterium]
MECLTLNKSNCKNCYKCIRHCPVKSIRFTGNQAYIVHDDCILCGHCFVVCPQNAKKITNEVEKVKVLLSSGDPMIVSLAPSFIANFNGAGIDSMREALKKLGFADVEETAVGATIVKREYDRMVNEESSDVIISSCCHSVNLLIQKYHPSVLPYLADVLSPMQAHCKDIKKRFPGSKTVFIGPCIAKKDEAQRYEGIVDAVLTFDELSEWLKEESITVGRSKDKNDQSRARFFPTTGGILKTMAMENSNYTYIAIDGAENCISAIKDIESGLVHHCFIEMSMCTGSCIGGPVMGREHFSPVKNYSAVAEYAGSRDFDVAQPDSGLIRKNIEKIDREVEIPTEYEIRETLRRIGKTKPEDELNCGTCGYSTCREKAIAICQGKADISMCLPYLRDKAETLTSKLSNIVPTALLLLNEELEIQQVNKAALALFNLRYESDLMGEHIVQVMNPKDFMTVLSAEKEIISKPVYLAEYDRYVEETIVYDKYLHMLLCILKDVTEEKKQHDYRENITQKTIETADNVVAKQMRIVQEIASLLGETAAETKIALTRLKESIKDE